MADTPSRLFSLVAILIAVWVLVYWLYEPRPPRVTADTISPVPRASGAASPQPRLPPLPQQSQPLLPSPQPESRPPTRPETQAAPKSDPPAPPPPAVIEPKFRQYVVQVGDVSWEAVAQRIYGDRRMWTTIAKANPLATSDRLKPGKTVLNIPLDPDNIQGKPNPAAETPPPATPKPPPAAETTYVVQEGDTLWAISKKVYGKGGLWERIYNANRGTIKDKDRPVAGTVLRVPARGEQE